jgi:hypothetical protein
MLLTQPGWVTASKAITAERLQGNKGIAELPPEVLGPRGRHLTGLVEPCGALPRKCYYYYYSTRLHRTMARRAGCGLVLVNVSVDTLCH